MSDAYVVDASVAVEYLLNTRLGFSVTELIENAELFAPEMMDAEVLSALRRSVLYGDLDESRALTALSDLSDWPIVRVSHRSILFSAWRHYQNVSAYDALYVATAEQLGLPMLTADVKLSRAAGLDIVVHNIRAE